MRRDSVDVACVVGMRGGGGGDGGGGECVLVRGGIRCGVVLPLVTVGGG
jgi:hypothetical protein